MASTRADLWYRSDRIAVRRLALDDIGQEYRAWFLDDDVRQFIKFARDTPSLESLQAYWKAKNADPGVDFLGIFDTATGRHVGNMKFEIGPRATEAHVGFLVGDPAARRRGLLRESFPSCVREFRAQRGALTVYLTVDPLNLAARTAFERLGFRISDSPAPGLDLRMDYPLPQG